MEGGGGVWAGAPPRPPPLLAAATAATAAAAAAVDSVPEGGGRKRARSPLRRRACSRCHRKALYAARRPAAFPPMQVPVYHINEVEARRVLRPCRPGTWLLHAVAPAPHMGAQHALSLVANDGGVVTHGWFTVLPDAAALAVLEPEGHGVGLCPCLPEGTHRVGAQALLAWLAAAYGLEPQGLLRPTPVSPIAAAPAAAAAAGVGPGTRRCPDTCAACAAGR